MGSAIPEAILGRSKNIIPADKTLFCELSDKIASWYPNALFTHCRSGDIIHLATLRQTGHLLLTHGLDSAYVTPSERCNFHLFLLSTIALCEIS